MVRNKARGGHALGISVEITALVLLLAGGAEAATLTVNANGSADYTKIQDAVNAASAGDTILVYSGTYYENVNFSKQLILRGVDNGGGKPVVDANHSGNAIKLNAGGSTLDGFDARHSGISWGIYVSADGNVVKNNSVSNNFNGIYLDYHSSNNMLSGNNINTNLDNGIYLNHSSNNTLSGNIASNNYLGIVLFNSSNNTLISNTASDNSASICADDMCIDGIFPSAGIVLSNSGNNTLSGNTASNNGGGCFFSILCYNSTGISLSNSGNNILSGNIALNNHFGISLSNSGNNILSGNIASNNSYSCWYYSCYGIYFDRSSNNLIYNNIFNNTNNIVITNSTNAWNITKTAGTNVIGGTYIGGNFWANPNDTGFSQTCTDADKDGICDSPYTLDSNNIDYLPLAPTPATYTVTVTIIGTFPSNVSINVYADGVKQGSIPGSGTMTLTFNIGTTHQISVDSPISIGTDVCFGGPSPQSVSAAAALTFYYICGLPTPPPTPLVSSITPNSRNAQVGKPVTIFMSVINTGTAAATDVSIAQASSLPVTLTYQQWNGTAFIGSPNTPVDIAEGGTANFVLTITATSAFATSSLTFNVSGTNAAAAPINAVNTLTIAATTPSAALADVIMISTTLNVSTAVNTPTFFAVATSNVGVSATGVSFNVVVPASITGLAYQANQTNPTTGAIIGPATGLTINAGAQPTFAVFITPTAAIANDPANNRITLLLVEGSGKIIGAQSVAVSTT